MIKLDIVNRVAERTGVPKMKAEQAVDALFHSMKEALARGERIELRGFGVFVVKPRKRGIGRNPRTGKEGDPATGRARSIVGRGCDHAASPPAAGRRGGPGSTGPPRSRRAPRATATSRPVCPC